MPGGLFRLLKSLCILRSVRNTAVMFNTKNIYVMNLLLKKKPKQFNETSKFLVLDKEAISLQGLTKKKFHNLHSVIA